MNEILKSLEYTTGKVLINTKESIRFDDFEDFMRAVTALRPSLIIVNYSEQYRKSGGFTFAHEGILYRTSSNGYGRLDDYLDGTSRGINDGPEYYEIRQGGFDSKDQLADAKKLGYRSKEEFINSEKLGFRYSLPKYRESCSKFMKEFPAEQVHAFPEHSTEGSLFRFALEQGFSSFDEMQDAMSRGFSHGEKYREAMSAGYDLFDQYDKACLLHIKNRKEYDSYRELEDLRATNGLNSIQEALVLQIMESMEDCAVLELKELWNIVDKPGGKMLSSSESSFDWYTRSFDNEEGLRDFIVRCSLTGTLGSLILTDTAFHRVLEKTISNTNVVVDGSNVAWGSGSREDGDVAQVRNLQIILQSLISKGFNCVTTIVDASLKHYIDDAKLFSKLKKDHHILEAPAGTVADKFILQQVIKQNAYIISNDRYEDWKQEDPWVRQNIDRFRIPFMFVGDGVDLYTDPLQHE